MEKKQVLPQVTIVSVTYNSREVIGGCLNSIDPNHKIIVVDNASSDDTIEFINKNFPHVEVIGLPKNIGFGPANNVALEKIQTEYAFILNPDSILREDTIEKLVATAENYENAAIIAPMINFADGSLQSSFKRSIFFREKHKTFSIRPEGDISAEFLSGAAMLLKMSKFKEIGFFDPKIFMYYEDDDLCFKVRKAGYDLILTPTSQLIHLQGKSSKPSLKLEYFKNKQMSKSRLYIELKYNGIIPYLKMRLCQTTTSLAKYIFYLVTFNRPKSYKYLGRLAGCV
jgi:N-acetylglucosaminyl-diphospho-decaprenol L-rhamnosyltransferase